MMSLTRTMTWLGHVSLFAASVDAHMIMTSPVPFSKSTLNNSPLANAKPGSADSDYPCKLRPDPYEITEMNNMKVGEQQTLSFFGSATHGGGACQLAITLDHEPTANSVFKIIQVFEGGCPMHNFTYTIPERFPNGRATFAWTWYNVIGNRELYMNCAPITVSGGADDHDYFNSLPNQYVINLPTSECSSVEGSVQQIPFPGRFVSEELGTRTIGAATGPSCAASAAAQTQNVKGYAAAASSTASSAAVVTSMAQVAVPSPSGLTTVPIVVSGVATRSAYPTFSPAANAGVVPGGPGVLSGSAVGAVPTGSSSSSSSSTSASCSENGAVVCNGDSQFGLCNFGQVTWQAVAAGTVCQNGTIQKRHEARNVHIRRHMQQVARKGMQV